MKNRTKHMEQIFKRENKQTRKEEKDGFKSQTVNKKTTLGRFRAVSPTWMSGYESSGVISRGLD